VRERVGERESSGVNARGTRAYAYVGLGLKFNANAERV